MRFWQRSIDSNAVMTVEQKISLPIESLNANELIAAFWLRNGATYLACHGTSTTASFRKEKERYLPEEYHTASWVVVTTVSQLVVPHSFIQSHSRFFHFVGKMASGIRISWRKALLKNMSVVYGESSKTKASRGASLTNRCVFRSASLGGMTNV